MLGEENKEVSKILDNVEAVEKKCVAVLRIGTEEGA
jgi:hypothetical protein